MISLGTYKKGNQDSIDNCSSLVNNNLNYCKRIDTAVLYGNEKMVNESLKG